MEIKRDLYLNQLIERKDNGMIKVITGIRRCGKSYLLFTILIFITFSANVNALTGIVNVNDSLTLRDAPTTAGGYLTSFYNGTTLEAIQKKYCPESSCSTWVRDTKSIGNKIYKQVVG